MLLTPLHYRVVGQDDYMLDIRVDAEGRFCVDCGDHTSHKPRRGQLAESDRARLQSLIEALGAPREHPAPDGATGFMARLSLGAESAERVFSFWEGALDEEPALRALIRALEVI